MTRFSAASITLLVVLTGCTVAPTPEPPSILPTPTDSDPVESLLHAAESAFDNNRLTTPPDDNALNRYHAVLALEPGNRKARDGINRIVDKYLDWAMDNAERGNLTRARQYVTRAESIDAGHPNIRSVVNMINDREERRSTRLAVDRDALRFRRADEINFDAAADYIQRHRAFVTIRAPDDASGRWLYQELNQRVPFRIEARFEFQSKPEILLTQ